ncbi:MAG: hypothetical protein LBS10_08465 [Gracilibacteraceae bacterium]|jgi:hypothetical protein|nr:hypothetical protein [Gracilibacteraceae bacterium]
MDGKKGSNKKTVLILGIVAIVCAAAVAAFVLTREKPAASNMPIINEENVAAIEAEIRDKVEKGQFETHMNTIWTFPDGKSASTDAVMGNSAGNNYPFYFEVIVNGDAVFTSGLLPVGSQMKEITLDKDLDAGTYPAVVKIHLVDENNEPMDSQVGFDITLVVNG